MKTTGGGAESTTTGRVTGDDGGASRDAAWSTQVYGTSTLFALLGMFALSNLVRLRTSTRRLLSTSHCLSIQLLVLFLAITRSIHLLYDAYNQKRLLPPALAFSIFNVAFPCLSSALAVLLLGIFKATKLQVRVPYTYSSYFSSNLYCTHAHHRNRKKKNKLESEEEERRKRKGSCSLLLA